MTDYGSALLEAAKEQPEDDLPRLALADWLEEHGDLSRAEFIRVQCRLARQSGDDPRRAQLRRRERELLAAHARRWVGGLARFTRFSAFERGLLYFDLRSLDAFLHRKGQAERRSEAYAWVAGVKCGHHGSADRPLSQLLKQADAFAGLTHLQLSLNGPPQHLAALAALPQLRLLTHLDLCYSSLGNGGVAALAGSPHLRRLTTLGLSSTGVSDDGVAELAGSPNLGSLRRLCLSGNPVSDRGAKLLAASTCLRSLTELDLFYRPLQFELGPSGEGLLRDRFGDGYRLLDMSIPPYHDQRERDR